MSQETKKQGRPALYPWEFMEVGQGMFFAGQPKGSQSKPAFAARDWARKNGAKFTCRAKNNGVFIRRKK